MESFQSNAGSISNAYQDTRGARVEKRSRIDLQDLKEQGLGEAHMFLDQRLHDLKHFMLTQKGLRGCV